MERLTPPPSGRLVPKIWTQWPLSPRLIKNFGPEVGPSNPQENNDSVEGSKVSESVPATTEPDDEKAKERKDIRQLRLLSPVRTKQKHDSLRRIGHPESCSWMLSTSQFNEWLDVEYSAVLCCYGPPGCGKTVLASGIVEALKSSNLDDVEVTYYYCDYANKASLEPAFILGALVRGLLRNYNIPEEVGQLIESHYLDGKRTPETSDVFQVLMQTVCWFQNVILVVDGIDEVDEADRNTILRCLKTLISCPGLSVKVFITSREDQNALTILSPLPEASFRVSVLESATSNNIESYVRDSVESMLPVVLGNMQLNEEVVQTLINGAKGIFLWVKLQLETLRLASREDRIKPLLQDLPKDLDETYNRLLQRLAQSSSQVLISRMFACLIAARRPLTMEELCEGMAFTLEDRRWDETKIPINDLNVLGTYGGLVVFDEKTRVVRLANYTVQQYLLRDRPKSCYQFNLKDANKHLGEVCIAYLCFEDFEKQNSPINNRMAIEEMISPISPVDQPQEFPSAIDIASITIGFRQSMSIPSIPSQQSERTFENFGLHRYAKRNWLWHAARFVQTEKSDKRDNLFQSLVTQKQLPFEFRPWSADVFLGNPYPDQMGWAITHNNPSIIKSLSGFDQWFDFKNYIRDSVTWVFQNVVNNSMSGDQLESIAYIQDTWNENLPMHGWVYSKMLIAARKGNLSILDLCRPDLDKPERPWNQFRAHLILEAAAANQHAIIDSFKLAQGPTIEQSRSFTTEYAGQLCNALERAALNGHADMVRRLGRAGWSASNIFGSRTSAGVIALNNAVLGNNSDVVKALLTALELTIYDPKEPTSQKDSRLSIKAHAFCKAASAGNVAVVKTFLEEGASPVAADESGMNAYMQAIREGHMNIFYLLFPLPGCGVEGNSTGFPLALAAAHGRTKIVELLISKGANVFQTDGLAYRTQGLDQKSKMPGPTPLYAAAANGHYEIVERVLAAGADADVISTKDVVQPIEGAGSARQRLYAPEQEPLAALGVIHPYQRPLCGAALNGHFRIVQLLLGAQALVNPSDLSENSPLLLALIGGHAEVANLLSSRGAEIKNIEMAEQALLACSMCPDGTRALQLLIEHGVSPKCTNFLGESSLHIATTAGLPDIMKFLIKVGVDVNAQDNLAQTPLMRACNSQNYRAAWILTTSGANLSATDLSGNSALSWTSVSGNAQIAHLLLSNGAPANSPNLVRQTPLLEAAVAGDHTMVKLLLGYGANTHARTGQVIEHKGKKIPRGSTALMIATIMNEPKVIGALCVSKKGVEDIEFEERRTSLLLAAESGKLAAFHALVKGGASFKARTSGGLSTLDLAVRGLNIEVLEYLMALQKRRLKAKKDGIFTREEFSAAISIMPNKGEPLSAEILIKLMKLGVRQEESEDCVPMVDPLEELWGW